MSEGECPVRRGAGGGGTGEGGRPDPGSLPGHDPDRGLYSKDNWKSLKGNKHRNDVIVWVLYKKTFGCSVAAVLEGSP